MWLPALTAVESFFRILVSITMIAVGFKLFQALNHYINKK